MRRSVKVAALASAATLLAIGASMTSFAAAKGWTQEDGEWVWIDSTGDRATETFKLSGTTYYWLNDEGYLGCDELVDYNENKYYVDETGAMVRNQWKEVENTDDDEEFGDTVWYYFQSSGKAYKSGKKSINGQSYIFDEDGKMLFGWIKKDGEDSYSKDSEDETDSDFWTGAEYYAGEANDGAVVTSAWRKIRVYFNEPGTNGAGLEVTNTEEGDNDFWFYFGSNGKKYGAPSVDYDSDEKECGYVSKNISGKKYAFSITDGHMLSEWTPVEASAASGAQYFSDPEVGARLTKGWFKVVPSEGVKKGDSEDYDNNERWFYADSQGDLIKSQIKTINNKKYLFDEYGRCKAGLFYVEFASAADYTVSNIESMDEDDISKSDFDNYTTPAGTYVKGTDTTKDSDRDGIYYFAKPIDTDAAMKTGTVTYNFDGDNYSFKFATAGYKGQGVTGRKDNSYYVNGRKLKAESDDKFICYTATYDSNGKVETLTDNGFTGSAIIAKSSASKTFRNTFAVINTSGTIIKSGTKKDGNDYKLVIADYKLTKILDSDSNVLATFDGNGKNVTTN